MNLFLVKGLKSSKFTLGIIASILMSIYIEGKLLVVSDWLFWICINDCWRFNAKALSHKQLFKSKYTHIGLSCAYSFGGGTEKYNSINKF